MDALFGRRKSRPRESSNSQSELSERSVRYEHTSRDRPPVSAATVSQALRTSGSTSSVISAPTQNPGLTASGTEMNFTRSRRRTDLDGERPTSPSPSAMSSSSYGHGLDSSPSTVSLAASGMTRRTRDRDMDATVRPSDKRGTATSGSDFGPPMSPAGSSRHGHTSGHRPSSSLTIKSDTSRGSHYTQAAGSTHSSSWFNKAPDDGFYLERPSDEDIQAMFLSLGRDLDVGDGKLTIENKWLIIYESEKKRWREENRANEKRAIVGAGTTMPGMTTKDNGESYIQKFMTNTITPKDIQGLGVSLRTMPLAWFHGFIDIQGIPVLASRLNALNRPNTRRFVPKSLLLDFRLTLWVELKPKLSKNWKFSNV